MGEDVVGRGMIIAEYEEERGGRGGGG